MFAKNISRNICSVCLGMLLVGAWQISAAAGMVTGKVTAINSAKGTIDINGITFELTASGNRELLSGSNAIKVGQAVGFEAEGKKISRIQGIKDGADFPAPLLPPNSVNRAVPFTR